MAGNQAASNISEQEKRLDRVLMAVRQNAVFLLPPLDDLMFGEKPWSLDPSEIAVLSLLSEYGKPVVLEELNMDIETFEKILSSIYAKLDSIGTLTSGRFN